MKKIICLFMFVFGISLFNSANAAEEIHLEDQTLYLIHFGRGDQKNAVNASNFYNFINTQFASIDVTGFTVLEGIGHRLNDKDVQRENTTIIEVAGNAMEVDEKFNEIARKYCELFKAQNVSVFIVKTANVSTANFF